MTEAYDILIVGGGVAGLTAASYACKHGLKTLLIEKTDKLGGLVNTFSTHGYSFDGGIRAFENSGVLYPMLQNLNIELTNVKNPVKIIFNDTAISMNDTNAIKLYIEALKKLFPKEADALNLIGKEMARVSEYMDVIYGIDNPLFLENFHDFTYLRKTLLPWLISYQRKIKQAEKMKTPVYTFLNQFTQNVALIDMIAQHFFKATPAFFALSYFKLYQDYIYPKGGTKSLIEALRQSIVTNQGEILLNHEIVRVDLKNNECVFNDQTRIKYQRMIWAADQTRLYELAAQDEPKRYQKLLDKRYQNHGGDSVLTVFLGLNLPKEKLGDLFGPHAFFTPNIEGISSLPRWQELDSNVTGPRLAWMVDYLKRTTYEISIPVLRDDTLASQEKSGLIISTVFDYDFVEWAQKMGVYQELKSLALETITSLFSLKDIPSLKEAIEVSYVSTPKTIQALTSSRHGAITGWSFDSDESIVEHRFKKIIRSVRTPIKDVFQCGQWTFRPSGLPVSIITGKVALDKAKKGIKR